VAFRAGAFSAFDSIEDATGGANLALMERPTAVTIARSIGAGSGREGAEVFAQGDNYLVSVALTGGKTTDEATFDEQQAVVGRVAWLAVDRRDVKWLLNMDATHVFRFGDVAPGPASPNSIDLSAGPELSVDGSKTVDTGALDARDATEFGSHCPQAGSAFGGASLNEDCLFLNVYLPRFAIPGLPIAPVMVWIHGGALSAGSSEVYDPVALVERGVVVVTINYRLGALGFLAHRSFAAESPQGAAGNYMVIRSDESGEDQVYMHLLNELRFAVGDRVEMGQRIASVGRTGRADGCHLHFELWTAPGWYRGGHAYDPLGKLRQWDSWS